MVQFEVIPRPLLSLLVCQHCCACEGLGLAFFLLAAGGGWGFCLEECIVRVTHTLSQIFSGAWGRSVTVLNSKQHKNLRKLLKIQVSSVFVGIT